MLQNKIKFVNNQNQFADEKMIMSFLNNSALGTILTDKDGAFFYVIETREKFSDVDTTAVFYAFTLEKDVLGRLNYSVIARASVDEYYVNLEPENLYIASLLVHEKFRDRGIGSAVVEHIKSLAYERGFKTSTLNATERKRLNKRSSGNILECDTFEIVDANITFYTKLGYHITEHKSPTCTVNRFKKTLTKKDKKENKSKEYEDEFVNTLLL